MSTYSASKAVAIPQSVEEGAALSGRPLSFPTALLASGTGVFASAAWVLFGLSCQLWTDLSDWPRTHALSVAAFIIAGGILAATVSGKLLGRFGAGLQARAPWLLALGLFLSLWEVATAKFAWLPLPFFPPPQTILDAYENDGPLLLLSAAYSLRLLALGFTLGLIVGFFTGVAMGWWPRANYWLHPIVRTIGPIPATAWLPLAFVVLPTSFTASIFILALATWFPVTFLTWSGVRAVNRSYYDVARTLGASQWFLIWKVAVPAALPSIFVGIFMGLGTSFVTLLAAEMLGVKAGLGWYVTWAQGWAAYPKVYAALAIMALLFSGLISILFKVRNRVLAWERGSIR